MTKARKSTARRSQKTTPVPAPADHQKTTLYLTAATHRALRIEALQRGMNMGEVVEEALRNRSTTTLFTHEPGER